MKNYLTLFIVVFVLLTACKTSENKNEYLIGNWYYLDYECTDSIIEYGEILITDSTFVRAYVTAGLGPTWHKHEIKNDTIFINSEFNYLLEKLDKNSFKLKYSLSDCEELGEIVVHRMKEHEFELKEFADYDELDIYFYNAFKRSKKYIN